MNYYTICPACGYKLLKADETQVVDIKKGRKSDSNCLTYPPDSC